MTQHKHQEKVETHLTLAIVALCLSCLSGFFSIAPAAASLILALRADDKKYDGNFAAANSAGKYAQVLGWIAIAMNFLPWLFFLMVMLFGFSAIGAMTATL